MNSNMLNAKKQNAGMKHISKAFTALIMAFALFAGTLTTGILTPAIAVLAVTQPEQLAYNPGHRDTVCPELSKAAKDYYSGKYSVEKLSALKDDELKEALHALMTDTATAGVTYKMLTKYFPYTDAEDGTAGTVLFYSDALPFEQTENQKATTISREHVWPKSHASFHESYGGADLHHLRPTDSIVNANRSSYCFGYVNKDSKSARIDRFGDKNTGKIAGWWDVDADRFEPLDNVKGDIARIHLYVYVRWEEPNLFSDVEVPVIDEKQGEKNNNDGKKVIESLDTLFAWMELDPVDTWEMGRNDLVQQVQGNRNVFIDHPELAYAMFDRTAPENIAIGKAEQKEYEDPRANKTKVTLTAGGKAFRIKISYKASDAVIKYKSSNKSVAKVTKAGKIKPVSAGAATVTVTIKQNGQTYKSKIAVTVK